MFAGFKDASVEVDGIRINAIRSDSGSDRGVNGDAPALLLFHGHPQTHAIWHKVAPELARHFTVIAAYLRGYGATRFRSADTVRSGQQAALAADLIALMDALNIPKAVLGGYDWGARTVDIAAALWPERVKALVSVSGYLIGSQQSGKVPLPSRPANCCRRTWLWPPPFKTSVLSCSPKTNTWIATSLSAAMTTTPSASPPNSSKKSPGRAP